MKFNLEELKDLCKPDGGRFKIESASQAFSFCERFAKSHYENFPVGSILLPKKHRVHFYSVYAFARISDDIADEPIEISDSDRIKMLEKFYSLLESKPIGNPVFEALAITNKERNIPNEPYRKLIDAFVMDSKFSQPNSWKEVEYYCKHSANPIGELVLRIYEEYNPKTIEYSDAICTGLQLVNFWQDFSRDIKQGRVYIPKLIFDKYNLPKSDFFDKNPSNLKKINQILTEVYDYTEEFFIFGNNLFEHINSKRLKKELMFTLSGGLLVLKRIRELGDKIIEVRPKLGKLDFFLLLVKSLLK